MTDTAKIIAFDRAFDATNMTIEEIRAEARSRGWPGIRIDAVKFNEGGVLIVERMSKRRADGEAL